MPQVLIHELTARLEQAGAERKTTLPTPSQSHTDDCGCQRSIVMCNHLEVHYSKVLSEIGCLSRRESSFPPGFLFFVLSLCH